MLNRRFVEEVFTPQDIYSGVALRTVFDKLAHASIMRLNPPSMDKVCACACVCVCVWWWMMMFKLLWMYVKLFICIILSLSLSLHTVVWPDGDGGEAAATVLQES